MKDDEKEAVDLGLESLLKGLSGEPVIPNGAKPNDTVSTDLSSHSDDSGSEPVEPPIDQYQVLWDSKNLIELAAASENQSDLEQRLWWSRSKIALNDIATVILVPSFIENISGVLFEQKSPKIQLLFAAVSEEILARVLSEKNYSLGTLVISSLMSQPILQVSKKSGPLFLLIERFFNEAGAEFEGKDLTPAQMKESLHLYDLKQKLSVDSGAVNSGAVEQPFVIGDSSTAPRDLPFPTLKVQSPQPQSTKVIAALILLVSLIGGWFYWQNQQQYLQGMPSDSFGKAPNQTVADSNIPPLVVPDNAGRRDEISTLDAVMYDVSNPTPAATNVPVATIVIIALPAVVAPPTTAPVLPITQRKPTVDTSGPIEPRKVKDLIEKKSVSPYEGPSDEPSRLADSMSDSPDGASRRADDRRIDSRRPDDRRPRDDDRPGRFSTGVRYEIMINTSVMDRASFTAHEVEELYVGDRVRVEARLGRWLKVRSRNGEPGYIMAQDAQKLFD